jgi:3-deoxy-7-phosphoheptulonate synthase
VRPARAPPRECELTEARRTEFERITEGLSDALDFSRTIGFTAGQDTSVYERGGTPSALDAVDFYTRSVPPRRLLRRRA